MTAQVEKPCMEILLHNITMAAIAGWLAARGSSARLLATPVRILHTLTPQESSSININ
jgi:hypothetical protein